MTKIWMCEECGNGGVVDDTVYHYCGNGNRRIVVHYADTDDRQRVEELCEKLRVSDEALRIACHRTFEPCPALPCAECSGHEEQAQIIANYSHGTHNANLARQMEAATRLHEQELERIAELEKKIFKFYPVVKVERTRCCGTCENCMSWTDEDGRDEWFLDCEKGKREHVTDPYQHDDGCIEWICDKCSADRQHCLCLDELSESDSLRVRIAELEKQHADDAESLMMIVEDNHVLRKLVESHSCESCFAKDFCVGKNAMKCADVQIACHREQASAALKGGE